MAGVLRRFFEIIDGPEPMRSLELLAPDLEFSILFSDGAGGARDFAGGRAEYDGYMAQRGAPTWTHHVLTETTDGPLEVVFGETRQDGAPLATFVAAVRLDGHGLIDRYIVGRSPAVHFRAK
jgi:hypothetical protein